MTSVDAAPEENACAGSRPVLLEIWPWSDVNSLSKIDASNSNDKKPFSLNTEGVGDAIMKDSIINSIDMNALSSTAVPLPLPPSLPQFQYGVLRGASKLTHFSRRVNILDLKNQITSKLTTENTKKYFQYLQLYFCARLSKPELDYHVRTLLGLSGVFLHNQLVLAIFHNVRTGIPPPALPPIPPKKPSSKKKKKVGSVPVISDSPLKSVSKMNVDCCTDENLSNKTNVLKNSKGKSKGSCKVGSSNLFAIVDTVNTVEDSADVIASFNAHMAAKMNLLNALGNKWSSPRYVLGGINEQFEGVFELLPFDVIKKRMSKCAVDRGVIEGVDAASTGLMTRALFLYVSRFCIEGSSFVRSRSFPTVLNHGCQFDNKSSMHIESPGNKSFELNGDVDASGNVGRVPAVAASPLSPSFVTVRTPFRPTAFPSVFSHNSSLSANSLTMSDSGSCSLKRLIESLRSDNDATSGISISILNSTTPYDLYRSVWIKSAIIGPGNLAARSRERVLR